jgi:CDP-glucose 4,6-dehydratase
MQLQSMLQDFYKGRRVLVTGHTGFKGSWLGVWLHLLGADVMGAALDPPGEPSMFRALRMDELVQSRRVDINDYGALLRAVQEHKPEVVIHLAAQALVRPSYQDPLGTLSTNVLGTAKVLEACRHCDSVRGIVIVTSDKCYRNNEWVWGYRENDPMGGHDPYSASKGCAELVTASYIKSFFPQDGYGTSHHVAVASARAGNAIGGGDWGLDRLIPDCFRALHEGKAIHIRYPSAVRPWQHAMECLSGYLMLGAKLCEEGPRFGCGWNFAPMDMGDIWPVEKVVRHICELWGGGQYVVDGGRQPHEAHMLCLDSTKARIDLGWRPRYRVAEALQETVAWYKAWSGNPPAEHMRGVTRQQILRYMDVVREDGE